MTKQDYGAQPKIHDVVIKDLKTHWSDDGSFKEVARLEFWGPGNLDDPHNWNEGPDRLQFNHSIMMPGAIKAFHYHKAQRDYFYSFQPVLVILHDLREKSPTLGNTMRFVMCNQLVEVPEEVLHGLAPISPEPTHLFYLSTNFFDGTDEYRESWDFLGKEIWEFPTKG